MTEATQEDKVEQGPVEPPAGPDADRKPPPASPLPGEPGYEPPG